MLLKCLARKLRRDEGMSLVELMVASSVVAVALTMLAGVVTSGLTATGYSRERQSANQLANETLELIRGLPLDTVQAGLQGGSAGDDLAAHPDANITSSGCGASYCFGGEPVVVHTGGSNVDPLVPHQKTVVVGPTTFSVAAYITNYQSNATSGTYRVTTYVTWLSLLRRTNVSVQAQTILFAKATSAATGGGGEVDCNADPTHRYHGPCVPAFNAAANEPAGTATVSGTIAGSGLDHATLWTGHASSDAQIEQLTNVQGNIQSSGASLKLTDLLDQTDGRIPVSSKADSDPTGGTPPIYDTEPLAATASHSQSRNLGAYTVTVSSTGGDTGRTTSTTSGCTTPCTDPTTPAPRYCPNLTGFTNETDGLPCGGSSEVNGASLTTQAALGSVGTINLAALGVQANPSTAIIDRKTASGGTTCTTTPSPASPDGCIRASITRNGADLSAGALPSNLNAVLKPIGFTYFARITGLIDSVAAESGQGANAPTATQTGGSVTVYCASAILGNLLCPITGYVTTALNQITSAITTPTLSITDLTLAGGTSISISATITPGSTSTTSTTLANSNARSSATATSTPPKVSVTYSLVRSGINDMNVTIDLDPGALVASTYYAPAPGS